MLQGEFFCLCFYFSSWDLDIRLGFDLCEEEREFLEKRKKIVSEALRKTLHLKESPSKDEVLVAHLRTLLHRVSLTPCSVVFLGALVRMIAFFVLMCILYGMRVNV